MGTRSAPVTVLAAGPRLVPRRAPPRWLIMTGIAIAGAWSIAVIAQVAGQAGWLHHHALIEGGPPIWLALPAFLVGWAVMIVAMMLPASVPTMRAIDRARPSAFGGVGASGFLAACVAVWSGYGLAAFAGDLVLHHVVDATPWLAANAWIIDAGLLAAAGAYQFAPAKRRGLEACRHPIVDRGHPPASRPTGRRPGPAARHLARGWDAGLVHGRDCLASSATLMLVMFAAGVANLWWMAILGGVMAYEAAGRHGARVATLTGVGLILASILVASSGSLLV